MIRIGRSLLLSVIVSVVWVKAGNAVAATLPALPKADESFESGSLHVDRFGSGASVLIFVPGLNSGPWSWAGQIAHFSPSSTVYALTLPGFNGRPFRPQPDLFAAFSQDFWALLDARRIKAPVVIGHSLGGTLAIALAEQHPERLGGVIALDGLPVFPLLSQSTDAQRSQAAETAGAQIAGQAPAAYLASQVQYMQTIGTVNADLVQPVAALLATSDPAATAAWVKADLIADLRPSLKNATVPILELMPYAQPSPYTQEQTLGFYQSLLAGAPHANVVPIPGARHFAMLDQPQAVNAAIAQFLAAPGAH
jgi:pimeloyl-ACP methyl ester carboxylesterase